MDYFQIDVQDGRFVPSITLTIDEWIATFEKLNISLQTIAQKKIFDVHLMMESYDLTPLQKLKSTVPLRWILVHTNYRGEISTQICPVLNPEDDVLDTRFHDWIDVSPAVQVMTVNPGPQGQAFLPQQLDKVKFIREHFPSKTIIIDGAVNEQSVHYIRSLGKIFQPDVLGVGSYLARAHGEELHQRIAFLRGLGK
jgi:ribulose-phosphate 3-epimerase